MATITRCDGTRLDVTSTGSGPGLVVLPGGLRHGHRLLAQALATTRTVHVIERNGPGGSGPPGPDPAVEDAAEDALAVLDATGSAELFGHSYGGLAGLHVARRRELRRLVIHEPCAGLGDPPASGLGPAFAPGPAPAAMATFLSGLGFAPVGVLPMPVYTAFAWFLLQSTGERETIGSPTLVIAGDRSPHWRSDVRPRLARMIPHAHYAHLPEPDAPDAGPATALAELVRAFLTTADAEAR
jgi:pimeloyl-ACP methyl ester carboxylesterase